MIFFREIKKEQSDVAMRMNAYRPAHIRAVGTDAEKERLSQIFTYHGGSLASPAPLFFALLIYYEQKSRNNIDSVIIIIVIIITTGKALPAEMCHPMGDTPIEIADKNKEINRLANVRNKYASDANASNVVQLKPFSHKEKLANQIKDEINDRCEYLKCMQGLNANKSKILRRRLRVG